MAASTKRSLSFSEAVETWILNHKHVHKDRIASKFDVNVYRLYEVWEEKKHIGSRQVAEEIINKNLPPDGVPVCLKVHVRKRKFTSFLPLTTRTEQLGLEL